MSPQSYTRNCRDCAHQRDNRCTLSPYEPCDFRPARRIPAAWKVVAILAGATIAAAILALCTAKPEPTAEAVPHHSAVQLLRQQHRDDLTDWQMLTLALMLTESRFTPEAVGAAGDRGILQLLPVYVEEANRLAGTHYTPEDAHDIGKALEIFGIVQGAYNPGHDIEAGIYHHNKSSAYKTKALANLETIRRYEAARKAVTK